MAKYRKITIEWSYPIEVNKIIEKDSVNDIGLYFITIKEQGRQTPLYIGKTIDSFKRRLKSHMEDWLDTYPGEKYVRLGRIVRPLRLSDEELVTIIEDAEKTNILFMSLTEGYSLPANYINTKTAYFEQPLKIINTGFRGELPNLLFIPEKQLTFF